MCTLLLSHKMFCKCLLEPFGPQYCSKSAASSSIFCLDDLSIVESGVLKSPTVIVLLFISPCSSVRFCFMYIGALMPFLFQGKKCPFFILHIHTCSDSFDCY